MKFDILKKGSIVKMKNDDKELNYFITKVSRKDKEVCVIPIVYEDIFEEVPFKLCLSFSEIENISEPSKIDLVYLLGKKNKLINNAIKKVLIS